MHFADDVQRKPQSTSILGQDVQQVMKSSIVFSQYMNSAKAFGDKSETGNFFACQELNTRTTNLKI